MAHVSTAVEYGLHCLMYLVGRAPEETLPSVRDLAELQGVSPEYAAKIFTRLQKAGLVEAREGLRGGICLARDPATVSMLDVVLAIDGEKKLFDCREIRGGCAVFDGSPPDWATEGICGIHAVMLQAQARMHDVLKAYSIADLATGFRRKAPESFFADIGDWLDGRADSRGGDRNSPSKGKSS